MSSAVQSDLTDRQELLARLILISLGLIAFGVAVWGSPWGMGIYHDAANYLSAAQNFVDGNGLVITGGGGTLKPLTHYPPLFPMILAAISAGRIEITVAARFLIAVLYGTNIVLAGYLVLTATHRALVAITASALLLISPVFTDVHTMVMSEPAYLLFSLLAIVSLIQFHTDDRRRWLYLSAFSTGAAYLTRYIGITVLITGVAAIIAVYNGNWRQRGKALVQFLSLAAILPLLWAGYNSLASGVITNRQLIYHPLSKEELQILFDRLVGWFLPWSLRTRYDLLVLSLVATGAIMVWWRLGRATQTTVTRSNRAGLAILGVYASIYLIALLISMTFFDASTPIDDRILSPVFISIILLGAIMAGAISWLVQRPSLAIVPAIILALIVPWLNEYGTATLNQWQVLRTKGVGFNSQSWQHSPTIEYINSLPLETVIYTNEVSAVQLLTPHNPYYIPEEFDPVQATQRSDYPQNLNTMRTRLRTSDGILVVFHPSAVRIELDSLSELTRGMDIVAEFDDSYIFAFPSDP